jgi:hypothetical protein
MIKYAKRILIFLAALFFLFAGILLLVLPGPGLLLIAIGILLLSIFSPRVRAFMDRRTMKYPKLHEIIVKLDRLIRRTIGEV